MDWAKLERSKIEARQDFLKLNGQSAQTRIRKMIQPQLWIQQRSEE